MITVVERKFRKFLVFSFGSEKSYVSKYEKLTDAKEMISSFKKGLFEQIS